MTDLTALQNQIRNVARARQEAQRLSDEKKAMYDEFISHHTDFFAEVATAASRVTEAEDTLRELTLAIYAETGNKKPAEGVGIREIIKLDYDPKEALKWAMSHQIALSLDKKSFEGFAKATPLEFVTVNTEAQATIATDLSKVIEPVNP